MNEEMGGGDSQAWDGPIKSNCNVFSDFDRNSKGFKKRFFPL